jgi:hypothetical protein
MAGYGVLTVDALGWRGRRSTRAGSCGEMAQLGAWVAADTGELDQAARYVRGGVMAARAGHDYALAGNIISTFSYQVANNGNPNDAAVLAQTAYQGGREDATPVTRALLLERGGLGGGALA